MEACHELCPRGDAVGVKPWGRRENLSFLEKNYQKVTQQTVGSCSHGWKIIMTASS